MKKIDELVKSIYPENQHKLIISKLHNLLEDWMTRLEPPVDGWSENLALSEKDSVLITYGDQFHEDKKRPLQSLGDFLNQYTKDVLSSVHILPFCPYSSDDGFSIIDYRAVNSSFGLWEDITRIKQNFKLMFDLVLNHCSAKSFWFKEFLEAKGDYQDFFIAFDKEIDLSSVFRPRAHPLLTPFETKKGKRFVWTTFSADQVDLDFSNPNVFLEFTDILLFYIQKGASIIRLDAIAYLWKEIGTSCLHHPKTHLMVKLFRAILNKIAPWVVIITETNVPHKENISYFGNNDEAQMVYQFSLPPLTLDAFIRCDATYLKDWARSLPQPDNKTTFFNFLASHDGIGVLPARGILPDEHINTMIETVKSRGGKISYKATASGNVPYEMNISYLNAISTPDADLQQKTAAFLASQSIMLVIPGVPGVYIHSFIGSVNWSKGVQESGHNRTINRQKFNLDEVSKELEDEASLRHAVYQGFSHLLKIRSKHSAFHPGAGFFIPDSPSEVFNILRFTEKEKILCIVNCSPKKIDYFSKDKEVQDFLAPKSKIEELISGKEIQITEKSKLTLAPFQVLWLKRVVND